MECRDEWLFLLGGPRSSCAPTPRATRPCVCAQEATASFNRRTVKVSAGGVEAGVGLVVLEQGQKVVVAVGWEVGRVEVRQ